ncbi:MAG TPA: alanine racemase [Gemmatales bacterium]|nr:alanine racemase [Gemmatales bacterium]HMP59068.1 alanine racemase [Gemmatales bacterium]
MNAAPTLWALDAEECQALAQEHGTPLFVYRRAVATKQYQGLRAVLPERIRLAYAVKANPHPELLRLLTDLGASFDCASIGELQRMQELGLAGSGRVFYAGPGKRTEELDLAVALGVRVQAEGWEDLLRLDELAPGPLDVNLRVHPVTGVEEDNQIIGGVGPSAFGVDEEEVPALLARARDLQRVRLRGLHVFAASNELRADRLLATHRMVLKLAHRLHREHGLDLTQVDLGGGLGVPYSPDELPLDVARLGSGLADLLTDHSWFKGECILEPGRYLAAGCGVYLVRVVRVKHSRGIRFAILEGGINHLLRPHLTGQAFPVRAIQATGPLQMTRLAGPLCTSLDRLGDVLLPDLEPGTLLAFGMTGAYGLSEGMTHFLSHPIPPEVWVD